MPTVSPTTTIPLSRGAPSLDIIDVEGLADAAARAFANDPAGATAYGTSVGYLPLRRLVAEWHDVDEAQVLLTNGSMQADAFLFDELAKPGKQVVIERPTYDRTLLALRQRGAELHPVALEPDGIDTVALEALLAAGAKPTLAHIIPNFHNPAGYTLSLAKRQRLVQLAQEHNFTIFEDDPYIALRFRGETHPTMLSLDAGAGSVVYASSFSKTVCPGIRVGYLVGPADLIAAIARRATGTYISPGEVSGAIVYEFCISGALERSSARVRLFAGGGGPPPAPPPGSATRSRSAAVGSRVGSHASCPRLASSPPTAATSSGSSFPTASTRRSWSPPPANTAWRSSTATTSSPMGARARSGFPSHPSRRSRSTRRCRGSPQPSPRCSKR
jgi:DNA-binding transcriptional MocR family regulator